MGLAERRCAGFITADVQLLEGRGHKVVERIAKLCGSVPTAVLSGNVHPPVPDSATQVKVQTKPFNPNDLATYLKAAPV